MGQDQVPSLDEPGAERVRGRKKRPGASRVLGVAALLESFWLIGQVARDRSWFLGLCLDIPSPGLAFLCVCLALISAWRRRHLLAAMAVFLALPPLVMIAFVENQWVRPATSHEPGKALRIVHWNIGYSTSGRYAAIRELAESQADILVVTEPTKPIFTRFAEKLAPTYSNFDFDSIEVIAKGTLSHHQYLAHEGGLKVHSFVWEKGPEPLKIFAVDIVSNIFIARDPLLQRLKSLIEEHQPDIIVGDFNSPRRSRALTPPPKGYVHAYDAAGAGWSYTWPVPFSVLAIDQCLISERIVPIRYDVETSEHSDHRRQVFDFRFPRHLAQGSGASAP